MPELPEVETIVRGLNACLPGKTVRRVEVRHPKPIRAHGAAVFRKLLAGKTFGPVERYGKFIQFHFTDGGGMIAHLRMTGKFISCVSPPPPFDPHIRLVFYLSDGALLFFKDMRLFGFVRVYGDGEHIREFKVLGKDPLRESIAPEWFLERLRARRIPIKPLLLDQRILAGLGNIYASEALFRARINPFMPAGELLRPHATRLLKEIRSLLLLAVRHNGTSIRDFRDVSEQSGGFQKMLRVY
ncbi:MAG TPA: bifunctional DNA-formamidopyrimidine glycosylase/DNA-(apurinic or apyrimidinic site) lyase, partial [Spirochaetia bacterium]|nr:bifunctional DNA-formamidopyrimidine glycosylase/DNA-(apurinic or apyrimidinic site) lyase [Spirochaetia bacterium]